MPAYVNDFVPFIKGIIEDLSYNYMYLVRPVLTDDYDVTERVDVTIYQPTTMEKLETIRIHPYEPPKVILKRLRELGSPHGGDHDGDPVEIAFGA